MKRILLLVSSTVLAAAALATASGSAVAAPIVGLEHQGKADTSSSNWSGYAAYNSTHSAFSDVKGDWTVPTANCQGNKGQQSSVATSFTGLDGYFSGTVEQAGTDVDCIGRTPFYVAWYEFYPAAATFLDQSTYPVNPGDHMRNEVSVSGGTVTVTLQNLTQNWTLTPGPTLSASGLDLSSAEWILEAPTSKLTNFGSASYFNATATDATQTDAPISSFLNDKITMVRGRFKPRATPSSLGSGGDNFTVQFNSP